MRIIAPIIAATLSAPLGAAGDALAPEPTLEPYRATYSVSRGIMRGESVVTLTPAGDTWTYHSQLRTTGLAALLRIEINEYSEFRVEHGSVVPLVHRYTLDGRRKDRDFALAFDWVERRVNGTVRGKRVEAELEPGVIDRHSVPPSLMLDLAAGREFPRHYVVMDQGRTRHLEVSLDGEETLRTAAGEFETRRVVQQRVDKPERRFVTWLAPSLGNLPVKIQSVDDDGATVTMELTGYVR